MYGDLWRRNDINCSISNGTVVRHIRRAWVQKRDINSKSKKIIGINLSRRSQNTYYCSTREPYAFFLIARSIFLASASTSRCAEVGISGSNILLINAYGSKSIQAYITEQGAS